jgi:serine/threonine protein kinase
MSTTPRVRDIGDVLAGKYVLRERLGQGGMGVVFRADQPALGRSVAIKVLHPELARNEWSARRFCDEAIAASRVTHPGAVSVIEYELTGDTPFFVMEHVHGRTLGRLIAEQEIPVPRALAIVDQILDVLDAAHTAGVVHADIKSDNVLVEQGPDRDVVTVIDFGLARLDGAWREGDIVSGTPEYMAPEIVRGELPVPASDLYGVAVILYELLTGRTPFAGGSSADIFMRHLHDLAPPPSLRRRECDLPPGLDEIVLRALSKEPSARFASARELQLALRRVARGRCGPLVRAAPGRPRPERSHAERPTLREGLVPRSAARVPARRGPEASGDATRELQQEIARALIAGDVAAIASGYLTLADALARDDRPADALRELEEGIDVLTAGYADHTREGQQLVVALAALSKRIGQARSGQARIVKRRRAATDARDTLPDLVWHAAAAR